VRDRLRLAIVVYGSGLVRPGVEAAGEDAGLALPPCRCAATVRPKLEEAHANPLIVHHTPSPAMQDMLEAVLSGARDDAIEGVDVWLCVPRCL
jgi:hypothetical protein